MGDLNAADFCAEAHTRVLRSVGSFPAERALCNGAPVPRGAALEALVIDDHIGIAVDWPGEFTNSRVIAESFAAGEAVYAKVNLKTSASKARRGAPAGIVLGA
jgi:hypothetical protein